MERIWSEKSDDDLLEAAADLGEYTEEGRRVIHAEIERRGLEVAAESGEAEDDAVEEGAEGEGQPAEDAGPLTCLRCDVELKSLGAQSFHEGRHWGILGEIGHLFEHSENFEVYVCPRCGHIEFFMEPAAEQDPTP